MMFTVPYDKGRARPYPNSFWCMAESCPYAHTQTHTQTYDQPIHLFGHFKHTFPILLKLEL